MQAEVICDRRGYYVNREGRSYYSGKYRINSCIRWAQQEATMYEEQAKELKKNTEVVRASFIVLILMRFKLLIVHMERRMKRMMQIVIFSLRSPL